ncbi:MAG: hypothetical protein ABL907_00750 [Hyphomicrobium sp.]
MTVAVVTSHDEELALVWKRIVSGDRIRIFHDFYGGQWIELTPRWQFWRRRRVLLTATEVFEIKSALREGRYSALRNRAIA